MQTRSMRRRALSGALTQAPKHRAHLATPAFRRATLVLSLTLASVLQAQERSGAITLDEALRQFRVRGFDLLLANASIAGAEGDLTAAGAIANPSFSVSRGSPSTYDPTLCRGCSTTSISAAVTDQAALSDTFSG